MDHATGFGVAVEAALGGKLERGGEDVHSEGPSRWLDLGSGGGLPGLVLAHRWPASEGVLLDASDRSARFLTSAIDVCGLEPRIVVRRDRAEVAGRDRTLRTSFDAVVSRSFGPPPVVAECAAPFLRVGGVLVVSEPPVASPTTGSTVGGEEADPNGRWPPAELAVVGLRPEILIRIPFGYQVLRQMSPCPDRFPRRVGVPAKRPLYRVSSSART